MCFCQNENKFKYCDDNLAFGRFWAIIMVYLQELISGEVIIVVIPR